MSPLDWILAALMAYSVARGLFRGFFREAFGLIGVIAGFFLACWFYLPLAIKLGGLIAVPVLNQLAAYMLILAVCMLIAGLMGKLLQSTASAVGLGLVDRLLGGVLGLVRGFLLGAVSLLALSVFLPNSAWLENSHLAPYFLSAVHAVSFVMPSDLNLRLSGGLESVKHKIPYWIKRGL